jgi:hypothetical protein
MGVVLALAAAPYAAAVEPTAVEQQRKALEKVQGALAQGGAYSPELLEPLTGLIMLYLESGDENHSAVALERALQVVRVNSGLYSLGQAPLIQQLIRVEEARGRHAVAWELEQRLLTLLRRHPNDIRTAPMLREIGDKYMAVLAAFTAGEEPPQVELGCFYRKSVKSEGSCAAGSRRTVMHGLLGEAQRHYSDAIAVLLRNELYDSEQLRDLEMQLLRVVTSLRLFDVDPAHSRLVFVPRFAGSGLIEPWRNRTAAITELATWTPPPTTDTSPETSAAALLKPRSARFTQSYYRGRQSLGRLYAYRVATESPPSHLADAVVHIADWELLYSHHGEAMELYARAFAMLEESGAAPESIEQLFSPATPIVVPAFQPNPLASDEARASVGYIDVEFEIAKYGRARRIEIVGASNAADADIARLEKLVATSRFRPRLTDGGVVDVTPVIVRRYLYD